MSEEITEQAINEKIRASGGALNRRQAEQVLRNQAAHEAFLNGGTTAKESKSELQPETEPQPEPEPEPETPKKTKGKAKA